MSIISCARSVPWWWLIVAFALGVAFASLYGRLLIDWTLLRAGDRAHPDAFDWQEIKEETDADPDS